MRTINEFGDAGLDVAQRAASTVANSDGDKKPGFWSKLFKRKTEEPIKKPTLVNLDSGNRPNYVKAGGADSSTTGNQSTQRAFNTGQAVGRWENNPNNPNAGQTSTPQTQTQTSTPQTQRQQPSLQSQPSQTQKAPTLSDVIKSKPVGSALTAGAVGLGVGHLHGKAKARGG